MEDFAKNYLLPYLNYTKSESSENYAYIILADGSRFDIKKGSCLDFMIDINGVKNPNYSGKDRFTFLYCPYENEGDTELGEIIPYKSKNMTREQLLNSCKNAGYKCSGLLSVDNWEFKDDYPYNL